MHIAATPLHWIVRSQSRQGKQLHCVGEEDGESVFGTLSMASMRWWDAHDKAAPRQSLKCGPGRPLLLPGLLWAVCVLEKTSPAANPLVISDFAFGITPNTWIFDENWRLKPVAQRSRLIYCVRKNSLQYSRHNYYKFYTWFGNFWHEPSWIL